MKTMRKYLVTLLLALFAGGFAHAAMVGKVNFLTATGGDFPVSGQEKGWTSTSPEETNTGVIGVPPYIEVSPDYIKMPKGVVKAVIERASPDGTENRKAVESFLSLLDANGYSFYTVGVLWEDVYGNGGGTTLMFYGSDQYSAVNLGRRVAPGEKLEIVFAWNAGTPINKIYVNKVPVPVNYGQNQVFKNNVTGTPFSRVVAPAAKMLVGAEVYTGPAPGSVRYWSPLNDTVLWKMEFHDAIDSVWDTTPPEAVARIMAEEGYGAEIKLGWTASTSSDVASYEVYRGEKAGPDLAGQPFETTSLLEISDTKVVPGLEYSYSVVAVDRSGNRSAPSETVKLVAPAGDGPAITEVTTDPLEKPMRPGQDVIFTVKGQTRAKGEIEITGLNRKIQLVEDGRTGVYRGLYTVQKEDVAASTAGYQLVAHLTDDYGASKYAGPNLYIVGQDIIDDLTPPAISLVDHDGTKTAGFSGHMVAGNTLNVTMEGEPGCSAVFRLVGITGPQKMTEQKPGIYKGSYTLSWIDKGGNVGVEATLADLAGNEAKAMAASTVSIDTRVRLFVSIADALLPADKKSQTRLLIKAADANGNDVKGHELMLKLSTTEEYTGVVGGGMVENRFASKDDEDDLEVKWGGVTDTFGEVRATYTAGFAAKTALIVVKDLTTGDIGTGWLNTYVASTVAIQLIPANAREAANQAVIRMSATPGWLTADGRSKARVRAWVAASDGTPIKGERVSFEVAGNNGSIKTIRGVTDDKGMVEADYRAGTAAGFVTVLATALNEEVTSSIQIELRADAPAKIGLVASAISLPADGRSTSSLRAVVTDINDNPNKKVPVAFNILEGSGTVKADSGITDDRGIITAKYTAGRSVGTDIVEARHTSRAPTEEELRRVYGTIFVPRLEENMERERVRVEEWYFEPGTLVQKGDVLVKLTVGDRVYSLNSPVKGIVKYKVRYKKDYVEMGDSIGYVEIDPEVWKTEYAK